MFHKTAVWNGHFLPLREVRIEPTAAGVLLGWGVYTSVRIYDTRPFNLEAHRERLVRDAERVGLPLPPALESLAADLADLARRNGVADGIGRVVILGQTPTRLSATELPGSDLLLFTRARAAPPPGESLWVAPYRVHSRAPLAGVKVTANMLHVQCRREALARGLDDALLLNEADHVVETATANVFWVRDGILYTPSLETGCLAGSTRQIVLELAARRGLRVVAAGFPLRHLLAAEEAFLTSVSREVSPVVRIGDHHFPGAPGPVTAALQDAFRAFLAETGVTGPAW